MSKILEKLKQQNVKRKSEKMSLSEFLEKAKTDSSLYATAAERMVKAIGEPILVDTAKDLRLRIIYSNRVIRTYKPFSEIFGLEDVIDKLVSYFKYAAQGLEEEKQILNLHGPVSSAKSTISEILKKLMEQEPIYVLAFGDKLSPVYESPLGFFSEADADELGIPERYLRHSILSPWAVKVLNDMAEGDPAKFDVVKLYPSVLEEIAIAKTVAADPNTQDTSVLVGKTKLMALGKYEQSDPFAYDFSGGLCKANQGLLEIVEMQKVGKNGIQTLNPLLTATQERNYVGTQQIGSIPFTGLIIAHTNDTEFYEFKNEKTNEALVDRMYPLSVPYNLRLDEEMKIYQKLIDHSELKIAPCAPGVLKSLAKFSIISRITAPAEDSIITKMNVYNGESMKLKDPHAKAFTSYKEHADNDEGLKGISVRQAHKILSRVFNYDTDEIAASPVHLLLVLKELVKEEGFPEDLQVFYNSIIESELTTGLRKQLEEDIRAAYVDAYDDFGQNLFDRYVLHCDFWLREDDFRDPNTGIIFNRDALDAELEKVEQKAMISNPKAFRQEIKDFCLRHQAKNNGKNPSWKAYERMKKVIDANITESIADILPVISATGKPGKENEKKRTAFIERMVEKGYTEKQIKTIIDFVAQS